MAYTAITPGEVDADSPLDTSLFGKVKDNFIDHDTRITTLEGYIGDYTAGDFSLYRHPDSAHNVTSMTAYTKELEVRVNRAGTYRVRFGLYNDFLGTCYGRVYKNGAPYGTARSHWTDGTTGWFSEDLTFAQGDLIQIYAYSDGSTIDQVRDLEIFVSAPDIGRTLNY